MPESHENNINIEEFQSPPEWLNSDYIVEALHHYKNDNTIQIIDLKIMPATGKGENYASVMSRVHIEYTTEKNNEPKNEYYIVKTSFDDDEFVREIFSEYNVFKREMEIYDVIFPKMKNILKSKYKNRTESLENLVPETIYIDFERNGLIFEDLSRKNFIMADRKNGLDLIHAKLALKKLTQMHASSAVLNESEPELFKKYDRGMFNRHTDSFSPMFCNNLVTCSNLVKSWSGYEILGEKLSNLNSMLMEYGKRAFDADPKHLNVLIHGDFWVNNVMFKYNEQKQPIDACLIDFQFSCWGSPALDLHYFLNTSLNEELRLHCHDELVQYYYYNLVEELKLLGFNGEIPSLHEFWIQYTEKSFYAFTSACLIQPIMLNTETEDADLHALMGNDERSWKYRETIYSNEKIQKNLKILLPIFDRKGLLDIN